MLAKSKVVQPVKRKEGILFFSYCIEHLFIYLRTFARNFSNIDFFLKILPLKDDELAMSEM